MTPESVPATHDSHSCRRFQFGLRGLLLGVVLASFVFAWGAYQQRRLEYRRQVVQAIIQQGGTVLAENRYSAWQRYVWGPVVDDVVLQIDLFGTEVSPEFLSNLALLSEVTYLDLSHVSLVDDDLVHLRRLPQLRVLYLSHTGITDAGLEHLRELPNLYELDLTGTAVSVAAATRLQADMPHADVTR